MSETWITARGKIVCEPQHGRIAVSLGFDFVNYYATLIEGAHKVAYSYPKHGAHISIYLEKIHGKIDFSKAKRFAGKWIEFQYNPDVITGGKTSGIKNFWMKVKSPELEKIKKELKIKDDARFLGLHLTICSEKGGIRKFQPKMIEIR